jgi:putative transposase
MQDSRRRLPHQYPEGKWLFLTWHLHGSLPHALYPPPSKLNHGEAFAWMDRYLDTTRQGPMYLRRKNIAEIVITSLRRGVALGHYQLGPYVIMANHVHVLLLPAIPPSRLLQALKGTTAREANRVLNRTGETFWQAESYDHWVRDHAEWKQIAAYIENNPVRAGVAARPEDYIWSSATAEKSFGAAGTSARATFPRL